ncbi:MAG TPA: hypothetical protein DIT25_04175 [Candidatus Moranbacteria bacterium]|nr:hypothetical protein [Candidatus Moranbacteria bacterium]
MKEIRINLGLVLLGLVLGGAAIYGAVIYLAEHRTELTESDIFESDLASRCEKMEWIDFPSDLAGDEGNYAGKIIQTGEKFKNEKGDMEFSVNKEYSLSFFDQKTVELKGILKSPAEIYVQRIRCSGEEFRPEQVADRQKIMEYVAKNITTIIGKKPLKGEWEAQMFYFIDNKNFYVNFDSEIDGDEDYYEEGLLLLNIAGNDPRYDFKKLAYLVPDEKEDRFKVIEGSDLFAGRKDALIYEFDPESERWALSE